MMLRGSRLTRPVLRMGVLLLLGLMAAASWAGEFVVDKQGQNYVVTAPTYSVRVEADGCLTSLNVGGKEFLNANLDVSRGSYLYYNWRPLKFDTVTLDEHGALIADSPVASIRYVFEDNAMTWTVENKTTQTMPFFMVPNPGVEAVSDGAQDCALVPVAREWTTTSWFFGDTKLTVTGGTKLWGPWVAYSQIWEATMGPEQTRQIHFEMGTRTSQEAKQIYLLMFPEQDVPLMRLYSPKEYQVFQRQTADKGTVWVRGMTTQAECATVRARFLGQDRHGKKLNGRWQKAQRQPLIGGFELKLELPAGGWYECEVQSIDADGRLLESAKLAHVGVGEVFVGAGQSNSTNFGQFQTKQISGMVASFGGVDWKLADDPQLGCHDSSGGGSFWPAFGDAMFERYGVPIGVATTGHGGTSVWQWKPGSELFTWTMTRIHQLGPGGFRALLWHQGESDVWMDSGEYFSRMRQLIIQTKAQARWEFPWFVAKVSYHNPDLSSFESTRSAHQRLWDEGIALEGPDTDVLTGDNRDFDGKGIHFSPKGLKAHGQMWAEKVGIYLDKVLAEQE